MRKHLLQFAFLALCPILAAQQAMNNDSVVKLVKAGLSDDLIVTTISSSAGAYDTSASGLIALKQGGASDKVIAAIVMKASGAVPAAPATSTASALPPGIDDVGVYYKDKTGAWAEMHSEIVNFKTGGVLKSLATDGLVKGDVNGHVPGAHAKLQVTFPVVFAIRVAEGVDIDEYQLLRLREHSNNREFRSTTGGVFHASGGAQRDRIEMKPVKLASRLYQVTLDSAIGKGEFGLLPPGSYSSSNMASGGKIYSVSIIE